ncbi:MAG: tryptophan-rich sensory protein [Alphaproteobacteria bacterium]|nr:tryptophan-rich sensory protein [Alphaproteobacteria bacterium]
MLKVIQLFYSLTLVLATALISKYFTDNGLLNFYMMLEIPDVVPPNNYFKIIWRGLYVLLFLSFYIILLSKKTIEQFDDANALFISQLFLQILWCFSFFYMEQLIASSIVLLALILVSLLLAHTFLKINKWAFVLLIPYIAWLFLALSFNVSIVFVN